MTTKNLDSPTCAAELKKVVTMIENRTRSKRYGKSLESHPMGDYP